MATRQAARVATAGGAAVVEVHQEETAEEQVTVRLGESPQGFAVQTRLRPKSAPARGAVILLANTLTLKAFL